MKAKFFVLLIGLCGITASCQSTPYIGLALPPQGSQNWNTPLNGNFTIVDSYMGGASPFPNPLQASINGYAHNLYGGALGSVPFQNSPNITIFLPGNITSTTKYLCETGTGTVPTAPAWCIPGTGTVSSFSAPSISWPSWLVPTVTSPTGAVSLSVAAGPIPNSALQNSSLTLGSTILTLGATTTTVTGLTIDTVTPATMAFLDVTSSIQTQLNSKAAASAVISAINTVSGSFTFSFSAGAGNCTGTTCTFTGSGSGGGSVTNFIANAGSWPAWLVPTVTLGTTTPTLSVAASAIPNSALQNASTTVNGQTCTLGSTCTITTGTTTLTVNGGSSFTAANLSNTTPAAGASFINVSWQTSGANISAEVPFGSASTFGVLECGSGTSCSGGVISATGSGIPFPSGSGIPQVVSGSSWGSTYNSGNPIPAADIAAIPLTGLATQAANTVVGNFSNSTAVPTANTISTCAVVKYTAGTGFGCATGIGTVTSAALTMPAIFAVSGSPITASGTFGVTLASQTQNLFFASPNGSSGQPVFRAIAQADLPSTSTQTICSGQITLSGTVASVNTASVGSASCSGLTTTDTIITNFSGTTGIFTITGWTPSSSGTLTCAVQPTAGTVGVTCENNTSAPITIGSGAIVNYRVVR